MLSSIRAEWFFRDILKVISGTFYPTNQSIDKIMFHLRMREKSKQYHDGQVSHLGVTVACWSQTPVPGVSEIGEVAL